MRPGFVLAKFNHWLMKARVLNLHGDKNSESRREPGRDGKILRDHRQDGSVAVVVVGWIDNNLTLGGPSIVSEIQTNKHN